MLAIPISILVLLAIIAVAVSPLLAVVMVGFIFAAFLGYAWRGPVSSPRRAHAGVPSERVGEGLPRHARSGWIRGRRLDTDACGARRRTPLARPFLG